MIPVRYDVIVSRPVLLLEALQPNYPEIEEVVGDEPDIAVAVPDHADAALD